MKAGASPETVGHGGSFPQPYLESRRRPGRICWITAPSLSRFHALLGTTDVCTSVQCNAANLVLGRPRIRAASPRLLPPRAAFADNSDMHPTLQTKLRIGARRSCQAQAVEARAHEAMLEEGATPRVHCACGGTCSHCRARAGTNSSVAHRPAGTELDVGASIDLELKTRPKAQPKVKKKPVARGVSKKAKPKAGGSKKVKSKRAVSRSG